MSATALQPEPHRSSLAARVLRTPLTELLRGHLAPALDAERTVAAAGLPASLAELTCGVIRRTRLWRREKLEVARELLAHFQDGLAAGAAADDLAASFGDPAQAAKLIRRAKRRNRPALWKALRLTRRTIGALVLFVLIVYTVQAVRIYTQRPNIARNFAAEWNAAPLAVPESERAWPIYRAAALALGEWPGGRANVSQRPGRADWPALVEFVEENARSVALYRQAAAMPKLAWVYTTQLQDEDARLWNPGHAAPSASAPAQPAVQDPDFVMFLMLPPLPVLRDGTRLLTIDAYRAAETNDPGRADADIRAILQMADHARETRVLIGDLVAVALSSRACDLLGTLLHDHPQLFSPEQLVAIAHRLATVGGGTLRVRFDSERAIFEDMLQRYYTDDGHGDGLPRPDLLGMATMVDGQTRDNSPLGGACAKLLLPAASTVMAGRRDLHAAFRDYIDRSDVEAELPLWERPAQVAHDGLEAMGRSPLAHVRYWPLFILAPALDNAGRIGEYATQTRDATLTALVLELYRRRHGEYPSSLAALTPQWLPKVPPDRYDGQPLKYRLVDGQPLLYSVGVDRKDDGGRLPNVPNVAPDAPNRESRANHLARMWRPPPNPNHPPPEPLPDGDWILWPPIE